MTLHLDDVEALRDHAYELQEAIPPVYMETNDPRIATLRAMVNNIVGFMDDWPSEYIPLAEIERLPFLKAVEDIKAHLDRRAAWQ